MEQLIEFGLFFAKALVIIIGIIAVISAISSAASKSKPGKHKISVEKINERFNRFRDQLQKKVLNKKEYKQVQKLNKKKNEPKKKNNVYIIEFKGGMKADEVEQFRDEVTAVISVAKAGEEVVVLVESPGGMVHTYGLAASQLDRISKAGLKLTVCIDKVAASGGYLMACTADKIIAAPFAIVGSIGVLAQIPNLNRLLKRFDVDYQEITAGEYKRTLSMFGPITEKGKEKFQEQIEETHGLFKNFVKDHRQGVDLAKVATGEYWYAIQAKDLNLVDEISTSDDYLFSKKDSENLYLVKVKLKQKLADKLAEAMSATVESLIMKLSFFNGIK